MKSLPAAALLLAMAAVTGCGGDDDGLPPAIPTTAIDQRPTTPPPTTEAAQTTASPSRSTTTAPATAPAPTTLPPPTTTGADPPRPLTEVVEITVAGRLRAYVLHLPAGLGDDPVPLVLDFHGLTATPGWQEEVSGFRVKADEEGFVVAQPSADLAANAWDTLEGSDDVAFVRALVADVTARVSIDPERIYAVGFSAGGGMANRLACDAADLLAAMGSVAGAHFGSARCDPVRPMPIIAFHGDADIVVPYDGFGLLPGVVEWAEAWRDRNGCATDAVSASVTDDVSLETWDNCEGGAAVRLYTVAGGGHGWPGTLDPKRTGDTTAEVSATDLIWEFFVTHSGRE